MKASTALLLLLLVPEVALAQASETNPRTRWGDPDLGGYWTYVTMTPLERPPGFEESPFSRPTKPRSSWPSGARSSSGSSIGNSMPTGSSSAA